MAHGAAILAGAGGLLLLGLLARLIWEPTRLEVAHIGESAEQTAPDDCNQRPGPSLRMLFFSDLHTEHLPMSDHKILTAMAGLRPDVLLFGGDLTGKETALPRALSLIAAIRRHPQLADCPFLAVPGNHDSPEALDQLADLGVNVLVNQVAALRRHGLDWAIVGLDDLNTGQQPDYDRLLKSAEMMHIPVQRRVILAHNPDSLLQVPQGSAQWFLAGHLHGGQIWAPFRLEFALLRSERLPKTGYYKGTAFLRGMNIQISRGLGCVLVPFRLFSKPELILLTLSADSNPAVYPDFLTS